MGFRVPPTRPAMGLQVPPTQSAVGLGVPPTQSAMGLRVPPTQSAVGLGVPPTQSAMGLRVPPTQSAMGLSVPPTQSAMGLSLPYSGCCGPELLLQQSQPAYLCPDRLLACGRGLHPVLLRGRRLPQSLDGRRQLPPVEVDACPRHQPAQCCHLVGGHLTPGLRNASQQPLDASARLARLPRAGRTARRHPPHGRA